MDLQYFGGNCVKLTTKKASLVIDDNLLALGGPAVTKATDISLITSPKLIELPKASAFVIDKPGEYEISDISIEGHGAQSHMDTDDKKTAVIYRLIIEDIRIAVVGHIQPKLSETQLEALGLIDILLVPVGGNGYTTDGVEALKLIKDIEPKIVIPTHYAEKGLNYEVEQLDLDQAIKDLGMEPAQRVPKLKIKASEIPEITQLIVLERQ